MTLWWQSQPGLTGNSATRYSLVGIALFMTWILIPSANVQAQASPWAPQQSVPGYNRSTLPPHMVADQNYTVHALASNNFGDQLKPELVIVYSQWRAADGWSYPTDVLLSPIRNQARILGTHLDQEGYLHVVFFGGDDAGAEIFHSKVPARLANNAQQWSTPESIGTYAITPEYGGLVGDGLGTLVAVYSGDQDRVGLYEVHSTDGGETWSKPEHIFLTFNNKERPSDVNMFMGQTGRIHVVWNVTNERGHNVGGYYTNADSGLWSWREPMPLDENRGLGIAIPSVMEHQNVVWVIYNNGFGEYVAPIQWIRSSRDGGLTWSQPVQEFPLHIGRNGTIALAVDSSERLHVMFGQRYFKQGETRATHGMWHSYRPNEHWLPLTSVVEGYQEYNEAADVGFDPYDARAVISQGNMLLLTWRTDPGLNKDGVWYSYRRLDSPELPAVPLPEIQTNDSISTSGPIQMSTGVPTQTVQTNRGAENPQPSDSGLAADLKDIAPPQQAFSSPAAGLLFGIVPTILFIGGMIAAVRFRNRR